VCSLVLHASKRHRRDESCPPHATGGWDLARVGDHPWCRERQKRHGKFQTAQMEWKNFNTLKLLRLFYDWSCGRVEGLNRVHGNHA
jgi:hypothetical protein